MASVRISVQQDPAGMANPKINKQRLPTDPLTQPQLRFHTWHLSNKRLLCGCMRPSCMLREPFVSAHSAELPHPSDPHGASLPHGWGIGPGIMDIACLPGGVRSLSHHSPSWAFTRLIFKLLKGSFSLRQKREQTG